MKSIKIKAIATIFSLIVFTSCQKETGDLVEIKTVDLENLSTGTLIILERLRWKLANLNRMV